VWVHAAATGGRAGVVRRVVVAAVGLPVAVLQAAQQAVFDLGCDVAVGLDAPVGQVMSESAGLRDFRDAVGETG
jgi:hypothetical protein